ncbi:MAG: hypothetical protein RI907_2027 [Pseudomonadota bacterium]|jgi:uncharacterized RDD family membrane protein YckC
MLPTPALRRRLAAFVYEGVLLFGVVMVVGAVYGIATNQRHALQGRHGLMAVLFLSLSLYFLWFWTHGGQTLAMKTWRVRLVSSQGGPVALWQALARFMLSWLWFVPPWLLAWLANWHGSTYLSAIMGLWVACYALATRITPGQQFVHDVVCRTRLVDTRSA